MSAFARNFPVATVSSPPKGTFTRVEVSALKHAGMPGLHGSSPLLRLQRRKGDGNGVKAVGRLIRHQGKKEL